MEISGYDSWGDIIKGDNILGDTDSGDIVQRDIGGGGGGIDGGHCPPRLQWTYSIPGPTQGTNQYIFLCSPNNRNGSSSQKNNQRSCK